MSKLDPRFKDAIKESVSESEQPKLVYKRLVTWLEQLLEGNESLEDRDSVHRHLELIYQSISTTTTNLDQNNNGD